MFQNQNALKVTNMDTENLYKLNMPTILPENVQKVSFNTFLLFQTTCSWNKAKIFTFTEYFLAS